MSSLPSSLRPLWLSTADRAQTISINNLNYELRLTGATKGRLLHHELVAGTPQLLSVIEIPLTRAGLQSMFDTRTADAILKLVEKMRATQR